MGYLTLLLPLSRLISASAASDLSGFRHRMMVSAPNEASFIAVCFPIGVKDNDRQLNLPIF